jgi:hypothetical protein
MQVLSCAPAQVRDSFSHYEGESPRGLDTELYGETNEKDSWGPRSLWPTRRFRVQSGTSFLKGIPVKEHSYSVPLLLPSHSLANAFRIL